MNKLAACLLLLLMVFGGNNVWANELNDAQHAMRAGNYAEAYCILKPLAEDGNAEAQYNIGWMYSNGYGLAINNSLALEWWRRASQQHHHDASFAIAMLYNHGEGDVERDPEKALDYFLQAAEAGNDDAILIIRSMLIRDDKSIQNRSAELIRTKAALFGPLMQVRVKRANVREQPNLDARVLTRLQQGEAVVELNRKGNWSQVGLLKDGRIAWLYSPLLEAMPDKPEPAAAENPLPTVAPASTAADTPAGSTEGSSADSAGTKTLEYRQQGQEREARMLDDDEDDDGF